MGVPEGSQASPSKPDSVLAFSFATCPPFPPSRDYLLFFVPSHLEPDRFIPIGIRWRPRDGAGGRLDNLVPGEENEA